MSVKQFITAEEHLAKLGVTVQQAQDFIFTNIGQPEEIYTTARLNGVTNNMLSEITNISTSVIGEYFASAEINNLVLNQTSRIVNSDLGSLETLVDFNNNTGILSNTSLRDVVQPLLDTPFVYDFTFDEVYSFHRDDSIYDAEELGVGHLVDVSATNENIESLFYGSLINVFKALDESELDQVTSFSDDGSPEDFQALLLESLNESPSPVAWTDEELANLVTEVAAEIINKFWSGEYELVGVIDHSYLGLATA